MDPFVPSPTGSLIRRVKSYISSRSFPLLLGFVFLSLVFFNIYLKSVCVYVYTPGVCSAHDDQQRVSGTLELEFKIVVSCPVGARKQTLVPWKSSQCTNH